MNRRLKLIAGALLWLTICRAGPVWACSACYGASDSPMAAGMNAGILTLLVVVVSVLASIASFFVFIARKSSKDKES